MRQFIEQHLLLVFIDGRHPHIPGEHYVRLRRRIAGLVDTLACGKLLLFNLRSEDGKLIVIEQFK